MTDTFRALCSELHDALEKRCETLEEDRLLDRSAAALRAALAQPELTALTGPALEDLRSIELLLEEHEMVACTLNIRRVLEAQPEPVAPTDAEIEQWADAAKEVPLEEMDPEIHGWRRCFTAKEFSETIRAALARWGRQ
jgi:hypothetical protein